MPAGIALFMWPHYEDPEPRGCLPTPGAPCAPPLPNPHGGQDRLPSPAPAANPPGEWHTRDVTRSDDADMLTRCSRARRTGWATPWCGRHDLAAPFFDGSMATTWARHAGASRASLRPSALSNMGRPAESQGRRLPESPPAHASTLYWYGARTHPTCDSRNRFVSAARP